MANKRPTTEQVVEAVVNAGATAQQGADASVAIQAILANTAPDKNDYLTNFNNKVVTRWNDLHSNATIYDKFKKSQDAPTLQAVVYERITPVEFSFKTDISKLEEDERELTRKIPPVHRVLKSLNMQHRFKTSTSRIELEKIANGEAIGIDSVVSNLGASYSDDRTERFIEIIKNISSAKSGDTINAMANLADVSNFIQKLKYFTFKFKEKRTDIYNNYKDAEDETAKADTKLEASARPVCFIDAQKLYKIEGDYYATLFQIQEALPDVDFIEVDGLDKNQFAKLCDPRVIEWSEFDNELRSEQILGRESGELNHYLFAKDTMGSYECFNRMVFKTA